MSNHEPPKFRFLMKEEGRDGLTEIGVAWKTSKKDVFSVVLDPENTGEPMRFMMVPNAPKQEAAQPTQPSKNKGKPKPAQTAPAA